jgi:hypothetical protein
VALVALTLAALPVLLAVQVCLFLLPYLLQTIALLLAAAVVAAVEPVIPLETIMAEAAEAAELPMAAEAAEAAGQGRVQVQARQAERVL